MIEFVSNSATGYTPLLKLLPIVATSPDYLGAEDSGGTNTSVRHHINMYSAKSIFSFRKRMREYSAINNPISTISMIMMSILGFNGTRERIVSHGKRAGYGDRNQQILVTNLPEVFVLAVIKTSDISTIQFNEHDVRFDPSTIKLLVSEKFRSRHLEENYNGTVAKYLRSNLLAFSREQEVEVIEISENEMKSYYRNPYVIKTNSISEIMKIDKEIKSKVSITVMNNIKEIVVE